MKFIRIKNIRMLCVIILISNIAVASNDYRCTIEKIFLAKKESSATYEYYKKNYVGKQFTVERASGLMAGVLKNSYITKPQVIDYGSKENSYKVVTTMRIEEGVGAGSNIYALNVLEYKQGMQKPFVFLENETVFFGYCEHF
jgi:hypothetical protein